MIISSIRWLQSAICCHRVVAVDIRHLMNVSVRIADTIVYRLSATIDTRAMYLLGGGGTFILSREHF